MKYVAEKQAASGSRKIGPSGRRSATGGDLLKGKLDGIKAEEGDSEDAVSSEDEGDTESE